MNRERLEQIAVWLEAGAPETCHTPPIVSFDMAHWASQVNGTQCGTVCCIGGFAEQVWGSELNGRRDQLAESYVGISHILLGLDKDTARWLFHPREFILDSLEWSKITPQHAARCIRNLLATGDVDWIGTEHA